MSAATAPSLAAVLLCADLTTLMHLCKQCPGVARPTSNAGFSIVAHSVFVQAIMRLDSTGCLARRW